MKSSNMQHSVSIEPLLTDPLSNQQTLQNYNKLKNLIIVFVIATFVIALLNLVPSLLYFWQQNTSIADREVKDAIQELFDEVEEIEDSLINEFMEFEKKFNRKWTNMEEKIVRFENFKKNYNEMLKLNAIGEHTNTQYGINEFSDWSDEEFQSILLPVDYYKNLRQNATFIKPINPILERSINDHYPDRFDWREQGVVQSIKSQFKCGSCWAFATVATVESAYAIAHGQLRNLSEQELLDCNLDNNACNGGDADKAFHFVHKYGLMSEEDYPYVAQRQNTCALAGETTKIDGAYFLNPHELSIMDWLVNFGPVNIGISVTQPMRSLYKSGVFKPSDYDCKYKVIGLHALLIVGYGTDEETGEKYWIVKNSWGESWGMHGYVNYVRGVNACGIEDEPIGLLA